MKNRTLVMIVCAAGLGVSAGAAAADVVLVGADTASSTEGLGLFSGRVSYTSMTATTGMVSVELTNTSPVANGGKITGVIFNINSIDPGASALLTGWTHPFQNAPLQSASPFAGTFEGGAALGGNWQGGGSPNPGIAVGQTGTFDFLLTASDAGSLSAASFVSGAQDFPFLVRFRGFANGGSDKVPDAGGLEGQPGVPAPSGAGLLALAGVMAGRRRRV